MTPVEQKAAEIIGGWNERLLDLADKLSEAAKQHGPEVADLAMTAVRVSIISDLVFAALGAGLLIAALVVGVRLTKRAWRYCRKHRHLEDEEDNLFAGFVTTMAWLAGGAIVAGVTCDGFGATNLFDAWHWFGLFEPQLWLAHKVLGL